MLTPKEINGGAGEVYQYPIGHSALFDGVSDIVTWVPVVAGSSMLFEINMGVKFQAVVPAATEYLFSAGADSSNYFGIARRTDRKLEVICVVDNSTRMHWISDEEFGDTTAHGHLSVSVVPLRCIGGERLSVWWNGLRLAGTTLVESLGIEPLVVNSQVPHNVGGIFGVPSFSGYISEFLLFDGTSAPVTYTSNQVTGVNLIKPYAGENGPNGKRFTFDNAADLGEDASGQNMLIRSQEADAWNSGGVTVVSDTVQAPDYTMTADTLVTDASAWCSNYWSGISIAPGATVVSSRYLKSGTCDDVYMYIGAASLTPHCRARFDLAAGQVIETVGVEHGVQAGMVDAGNGWYRCWISGSFDPSVTLLRNDLSPQGNNLDLHAWGGQFEYGERPGAYKPTLAEAYTGASVLGGPVQTLDTPTNNYCTMNPRVGLGYADNVPPTYGEGNLKVSGAAIDPAVTRVLQGTMSTSSKLYFEDTYLGNSGTLGRWAVGVSDAFQSRRMQGGFDAHSVVFRNANDMVHDSIMTATGASLAVNDVVQVAFDPATGKLWIGINGTWFNSGDPETGTNPSYEVILGEKVCPCISAIRAGDDHRLNFGSQGFAFTPPDGFQSLCSDNLSEPTVIKSSSVADVVLRAGTGAAASVDSLRFSPDFVNIKDRDSNYGWVVSDSARGATKYLSTDAEYGEIVNAAGLTGFESTGYSLGSWPATNGLDARFVDLCLKAGPDHGFEIVTYTGDGTSGRWITHGMGKAPTFMMVKNISSDGPWVIYHKALGGLSYLVMDDSAAFTNGGAWHNTDPTTLGFRVSYGATNMAGDDYVAYLFADSDIFRAFSYTGTGLADGPFIHLGGRPLAIPFWKNTETATYQWYDVDAARNSFNPIENYLHPNAANAEAVWEFGEFTSQGFKITTTGPGVNEAEKLMIGLAVIESDQKYSNAY